MCIENTEIQQREEYHKEQKRKETRQLFGSTAFRSELTEVNGKPGWLLVSLTEVPPHGKNPS